MELDNLIKKVDHTLLRPDTEEKDIFRLCTEAVNFGFASVCIPPCFVASAAELLNGKIPVCTVIGFPLGYNATDMKIAEARQALADGASELDMVINIGRLHMGDERYVRTEIEKLKQLAGSNVLKVIIETCLLSEEQKIAACAIVTAAGADFIKTSTGFAGGGATAEDVRLLRRHVGASVKVKASGGIKSKEQAIELVAAGADRLGMSSAIKAFSLQ